jgi:glycosyltransferase involved in cell wall biosynthesis
MFFVYELEKFYDVDIFWSSRWKGVPDSYLKKLHAVYHHAIYWQVFPDLSYKHPVITVLVPMWDSVYSESREFYERYSDFNFLSFSRSLHNKCLEYGLKSEYLKVIPKGKLGGSDGPYEVVNKSKPSIYFWQRTSDITWSDVKKIIGSNVVEKVVLCNAVDPGFDFIKPCREDVEKYNIEIVSWNDNQASVKDMLKQTDIYIAPRKFEGIGFSFLGAIECGCTVICNDQSTMNEYVDDRVGYLIDYENPAPIDLSDWFRKKKEMRKRYSVNNNLKEAEFTEKINCIFVRLFND